MRASARSVWASISRALLAREMPWSRSNVVEPTSAWSFPAPSPASRIRSASSSSATCSSERSRVTSSFRSPRTSASSAAVQGFSPGLTASCLACAFPAFLAGAFFAGAFFAGAFFAGAFLAGAFLAGAFVAGAFFAGAFLAGAFFAGAFFAGAFFAGAFFAGAFFAGAFFAGAFFAGAFFAGAFFAGAFFAGAFFAGAFFAGAFVAAADSAPLGDLRDMVDVTFFAAAAAILFAVERAMDAVASLNLVWPPPHACGEDMPCLPLHQLSTPRPCGPAVAERRFGCPASVAARVWCGAGLRGAGLRGEGTPWSHDASIRAAFRHMRTALWDVIQPAHQQRAPGTRRYDVGRRDSSLTWSNRVPTPHQQALCRLHSVHTPGKEASRPSRSSGRLRLHRKRCGRTSGRARPFSPTTNAGRRNPADDREHD